MMRWVASRNSTSQMTGRQGLLTKLLKDAMKSAADFPAKTVGSRFADKLKRPSCHNGVISQNKESGQYAHTSYPAPMRAGCQFLISPCRIGTRAPADEEFCNHDGDAENEHANQVYKDNAALRDSRSQTGNARYCLNRLRSLPRQV